MASVCFSMLNGFSMLRYGNITCAAQADREQAQGRLAAAQERLAGQERELLDMRGQVRNLTEMRGRLEDQLRLEEVVRLAVTG